MAVRDNTDASRTNKKGIHVKPELLAKWGIPLNTVVHEVNNIVLTHPSAPHIDISVGVCIKMEVEVQVPKISKGKSKAKV